MSDKQEQRDRAAQRAAYLCAERGLTQREIGQLFGGLSQSRVSRLLSAAEKAGWLARSYQLISDRFPPGRLEELRKSEEPTDLLKALDKLDSETGVRVRQARVIATGPAGMSDRSIAMRLNRLGRATVNLVDDWLSNATCVGVTWGRTISTIIGALGPERPGGKKPRLRATGRKMIVIPVCAEPMKQAASVYTSTHLAVKLREVLELREVPPSLTGLPAFIPRRYGPEAVAGIRELMADSPSYQAVFGGNRPLIRQVDLLLTSVGSRHRSMGFAHEEFLRAAGEKDAPMSEEEFDRLFVGDIGGVLLPRNPADAKARELSEMWTGAKRADFEHIAKTAARTSKPGVIVFSVNGEGRADAIALAVRQGLVNELVIDRTLADALTRLLQREDR
jgi:DNA-binding transcriptional regulator LsrR (DeoR family)